MGAITEKNKYGTLAPGPGAYDVTANLMKTQNFKYSMGQKLEQGGIIDSPKGKTLVPGPGGYDPKKMFHSDGFTRFGTSKRPGIYNERNAKAFPSPDNYQQDASKIMRRSAQYSFGGQSQRARISGTLAPGPGAYDIKQLVGNESPAKTLHSKLSPAFEKPGANKFPGPGSYAGRFDAGKAKDPQWRFGSSTRDDEMKTMRRVFNNPAPDAYDPRYKAGVNKDPIWAFGSSQRTGLQAGKTVSPGCQTYDIRSKAVEGSRWSMGLKLDATSCL